MSGAADTPDPADVAAIEQVVRRSAAHNDRREWPALAALYTEDATLTRPNGQRVEGRAAIEAAYAAGSPERRTRHVCGGPVIQLADAGTVRATTPVLLFTWQHTDGPGQAAATGPAVGEFADVLVRTQAGWLIHERVATISASVRVADD